MGMSQRDTDLIHGLTFDFAFAAMAPESVELADWIKADLLPVIEDVLDQHRALGQRRRIERLEIDLGTVSADQARSELARRLFEQLSVALDEVLDGAGAADEAAGGEQAQGGDMLAFLRSGTIPWTVASDANEAHKKLLQQVIESPQAHQVLGVALNDARMLTRLIRQYDAQQLLAAAGVLFTPWPQTERAAALAWAADELGRLQHGGEAESFWRWFLAQSAHPASPDLLQARWTQASGGAPQMPASASATAIAGFSARAALAIEQGLESAEFGLLAPYWDRILASAPQCLRSACPRLWQRWLEKFDADTLADILGVTQADCAWLIECLATVVPRARLNALLRPAMAQWLAAPVDSLAPQLVLDWVKAALPEQSGRIAALFAAGGAGPQQGEPVHATDSSMIRQSDQQLLSAARGLFLRWPPAQRDAVLAWAGDELRRLRDAGLDPAPFWRWLLTTCARPVHADVLMRQWTGRHREAKAGAASVDRAGFTAAEMRAIEQGLEAADFALLAPYWERILASAPQYLRAAHPRRWKQWLDHFDDETLTDIVGVVQADCAWLIEAFATMAPLVRGHAQLRPALQQWLAAPVDSLAPRRVLEWVTMAVPEQSAPILALFTAQ
jgi:hypothetical protein